MQILEHLKKLEAKATPGKWKFVPNSENSFEWRIENEEGDWLICEDEIAGVNWDEEKANARLCVAMKNTLPLLIELAETAKLLVEGLNTYDPRKIDFDELERNVNELKKMKTL